MNWVIKTINNQWQSHCHTFQQPWNIGERYAKKYFQAFIFSMEKRPSASKCMHVKDQQGRAPNKRLRNNELTNQQSVTRELMGACVIDLPFHPFYRRGPCLRNRLVHFVKFAKVWSRLSSDNSSLSCPVTTEVVHLIQVVVQSEKGKI